MTLHLGVHWLADAVGCHAEALADEARVAELLCSLAVEARLTALGEPMVERSAQGVVAVLLLAESHASVHTDVAAHTAFVDVFSCAGLPRGSEALRDRVATALGATAVHTRTIPRGPA